MVHQGYAESWIQAHMAEFHQTPPSPSPHHPPHNRKELLMMVNDVVEEVVQEVSQEVCLVESTAFQGQAGYVAHDAEAAEV